MATELGHVGGVSGEPFLFANQETRQPPRERKAVEWCVLQEGGSDVRDRKAGQAQSITRKYHPPKVFRARPGREVDGVLLVDFGWVCGLAKEIENLKKNEPGPRTAPIQFGVTLSWAIFKNMDFK